MESGADALTVNDPTASVAIRRHLTRVTHERRGTLFKGKIHSLFESQGYRVGMAMPLADSIIPSRDERRFSAEPRTRALPEMAAGVIILGEEREVEYVNASAEALFVPFDPVGCDMPALLASCGATVSDDIFTAPELNGDHLCRIRMADDRLLDCALRRLSTGGYVISLDDVTAYVANAEMALRDTLTGLANRKAFMESLSERVKSPIDAERRFALLFLDLDRFKSVNDSLGHPIGDALLRKVAGRLENTLGPGDIVARLGGDEFAIIQVAGPQPGSADTLAARLVDLLGRAYVLEGHYLHIGVSIGIALSSEGDTSADILLKNADVALYRAKADGRGRHRFFEPGMYDRIQARRSLELDLRRALAFKELQLAFQPQISLATNSIVGFEALIRWNHPTRGIVSPAEFIPIAEDTGIIVPISEWVLRTACCTAMDWPADITVAVNLSPVQFRSGRLLESVTAALAHSGLEPNRLDLEITEGSLLEGSHTVLRLVQGLRDLGVRVSMDDFGTGYSSLSYLQTFPFDKIKIDRSFVQGIDRKPDRLAILKAITAMADVLGMKTTAEGVETDAELACVRSVSCHEVQGFLTGRPVTAEAAIALLDAQRTNVSKETA